MSAEFPTHPQNRILSLLPHDEAKRLAPHLESVELEFKQVLCEPGEPMEHVYFPTSGVVSKLAFVDGATAEVATIGDEGMIGARAYLGDDNNLSQLLVQVPGQALRMKVDAFREQSRPESTLGRLLDRYLIAFLTQVTQSVACNTFHSVEKRFCRWLLMTHDRVHADQFPLTQEVLAQMLGVRRASVSEAARKLQSAGLIRYVHGKITILDRAALEAASCSCYQAVKADYDALLSGNDV